MSYELWNECQNHLFLFLHVDGFNSSYFYKFLIQILIIFIINSRYTPRLVLSTLQFGSINFLKGICIGTYKFIRLLIWLWIWITIWFFVKNINSLIVKNNLIHITINLLFFDFFILHNFSWSMSTFWNWFVYEPVFWFFRSQFV